MELQFQRIVIQIMCFLVLLFNSSSPKYPVDFSIALVNQSASYDVLTKARYSASAVDWQIVPPWNFKINPEVDFLSNLSSPQSSGPITCCRNTEDFLIYVCICVYPIIRHQIVKVCGKDFKCFLYTNFECDILDD